MRYIHSQESLTIPDGGKLFCACYLYHSLHGHRIRGQDKTYIETDLLTPVIVKVAIKSRIVKVEGPRGIALIDLFLFIYSCCLTGTLTKNLSHLSVNFSHPSKSVINIELHHGARKSVATLRTVKTLINNLIIGVTKGFKYKMRYVYAHFPINVNIEKNPETDLLEVDIRYDWQLDNEMI